MKAKRSKKKIILVTVIILLLALIGLMLILANGYCPELGRSLTDQEKCDIAVQAIINDKGRYIQYPYINEDGKKLPYNKIVQMYDYSSLEEFYAMNPDCYKFVETIDTPDAPPFTIPYREKISGRLNTFIIVSYIFAFDKQNNNAPIYKGRIFGLSNCGELWTYQKILRLQERYHW